MKTKFKKLIVVLLACLFAGMLAACDAGVDVYEAADEENWYFNIDIKLNKMLVNSLDANAAYKVNNNFEKWSVEDWLNEYFYQISNIYKMDYKYDSEYVGNDSNYKYYAFSLLIPRDSNLKDMLTLESNPTYKDNPFLRTYSVTRDGRFDYWRNEFVSAYDRYKSGNEIKEDYTSLTGVLINGLRIYSANEQTAGAVYDDKLKEYYTPKLESFLASFNMGADGFSSYTNFVLDNYWQASKNYKMNSDDAFKIDQFYNFYYFHQTMGSQNTPINYTFYRAIAYGWYIVAMLAGAATLGIILLICKYKKDKPKPQAGTPYTMYGTYMNNNPNNPYNNNQNTPYNNYPNNSQGNYGGGNNQNMPYNPNNQNMHYPNQNNYNAPNINQAPSKGWVSLDPFDGKPIWQPIDPFDGKPLPKAEPIYRAEVEKADGLSAEKITATQEEKNFENIKISQEQYTAGKIAAMQDDNNAEKTNYPQEENKTDAENENNGNH